MCLLKKTRPQASLGDSLEGFSIHFLILSLAPLGNQDRECDRFFSRFACVAFVCGFSSVVIEPSSSLGTA